jgi:hypothetical protein
MATKAELLADIQALDPGTAAKSKWNHKRLTEELQRLRVLAVTAPMPEEEEVHFSGYIKTMPDFPSEPVVPVLPEGTIFIYILSALGCDPNQEMGQSSAPEAASLSWWHDTGHPCRVEALLPDGSRIVVERRSE